MVCFPRLPVCVCEGGGWVFVFPTKPRFYPQVNCCIIYSDSSVCVMLVPAVASCPQCQTALAWNVVDIFKMTRASSMPNGVGAGSCLPGSGGKCHAQRLPLLIIPEKPFALFGAGAWSGEIVLIILHGWVLQNLSALLSACSDYACSPDYVLAPVSPSFHPAVHIHLRASQPSFLLSCFSECLF